MFIRVYKSKNNNINNNSKKPKQINKQNPQTHFWQWLILAPNITSFLYLWTMWPSKLTSQTLIIWDMVALTLCSKSKTVIQFPISPQDSSAVSQHSITFDLNRLLKLLITSVLLSHPFFLSHNHWFLDRELLGGDQAWRGKEDSQFKWKTTYREFW